VADFDGDGAEDAFLAQNFFGVPPLTSRHDAGLGVLLRGNGTGGFVAVSPSGSGLRIHGEGRGAAVADYDRDGRTDLAVAQQAQVTRLFRNRQGRPGLRVQLQGPPANPHGVGAVIRLAYAEGSNGPARAIHAGGGYWSQDSSVAVLAWSGAPARLIVRWPGGKVTEVPLVAGTLSVSPRWN
jgi:hypothetical protein